MHHITSAVHFHSDVPMLLINELLNKLTVRSATAESTRVYQSHSTTCAYSTYHLPSVQLRRVSSKYRKYECAYVCIWGCVGGAIDFGPTDHRKPQEI